MWVGSSEGLDTPPRAEQSLGSTTPTSPLWPVTLGHMSTVRVWGGRQGPGGEVQSAVLGTLPSRCLAGEPKDDPEEEMGLKTPRGASLAPCSGPARALGQEL